MNPMFKGAIFGGVGGFMAGSLATFLVMRGKYEDLLNRLIYVNEEWDEMYDHFNEVIDRQAEYIAELTGEGEDNVNPIDAKELALKNREDKAEMTQIIQDNGYSQDEETEDIDEENEDADEEEEFDQYDETGPIRVISREEWSELDKDFYDAVTWEYYEGDGIVIDDVDDVVPVPLECLGMDGLDSFGMYPAEDKNIAYILNPPLRMVFELIRHKGSYTEEVLGIKEEAPHGKKHRFEDDE